MKIVEYVHLALRDNRIYKQLDTDLRKHIAYKITRQLIKNIPNQQILMECCQTNFQEFIQIINATFREER